MMGKGTIFIGNVMDCCIGHGFSRNLMDWNSYVRKAPTVDIGPFGL